MNKTPTKGYLDRRYSGGPRKKKKVGVGNIKKRLGFQIQSALQRNRAQGTTQLSHHITPLQIHIIIDATQHKHTSSKHIHGAHSIIAKNKHCEHPTLSRGFIVIATRGILLGISAHPFVSTLVHKGKQLLPVIEMISSALSSCRVGACLHIPLLLQSSPLVLSATLSPSLLSKKQC